MQLATKLGLAGAALLVSVAAYASVNCSIDNSSAYFTGTTRSDSATGKLLWEYKCARGHTFWIVKS